MCCLDKHAPKGEVYEQHMFSNKNDYFKSRAFVREVKHHYTEIMNQLASPNEQLKVFNPDGPYLATKKTGKHNPHEKEIREDNMVRDEYDVDVKLTAFATSLIIVMSILISS